MRMIDIIEHKRDKKLLTEKEVTFFINEYINKKIPDYQVSTLLMAIYLNGMDESETFYLTKAMLNSGSIMDLKKIQGIRIDKHSTGGVGDKITLVLAPLLATFGLKVAKMSGRGLGHTGGTLDKLESISGFDIALSKEEFSEQVNEIGISIIGQTEDLVPADKLLYALRDVTGTVESIPLIASSIMSKKMATNPDILCLDVKVGSGAFMKDVESGIKLANTMVNIGKRFNVKVIAVLSNMSEPLGYAIGNILEVKEAIDSLKGKGPKDFEELLFTLCEEILIKAEKAKDIKEARRLISDKINSNEAFEKFKQFIKSQKGNINLIDDVELFPKAKNQIKVLAVKKGYVNKINAYSIGEISMKLGAGRVLKNDIINPRTGIIICKKSGDFANKGDVLAIIHTDGVDVYQDVYDAFTINSVKSNKKMILKIIRG